MKVLRSGGVGSGSSISRPSRYIQKMDGVNIEIDAEHFGNEFRFMNSPEVTVTQVRCTHSRQACRAVCCQGLTSPHADDDSVIPDSAAAVC